MTLMPIFWNVVTSSVTFWTHVSDIIWLAEQFIKFQKCRTYFFDHITKNSHEIKSILR